MSDSTHVGGLKFVAGVLRASVSLIRLMVLTVRDLRGTPDPISLEPRILQRS